MNVSTETVWVTGASSGIGEALALELATRGAKVVLSARREDRLEALRARCPDPSRVCVVPMDVAETDRAEAHVERAIALAGPIDVMVHNAGIGQRSRVAETDLSVDRRLMEVNYFGVVALTKALLPRFRARGRGRFVVVSSVTGYVGTPERSAYAASKHALHGFFESLRAEHHADGIGVTMVCPGFVDTDITKDALRGDGTSRGVKSEKSAVGIRPERCARAIVRGIERGQREVYVGGVEVAGIYARRYAPGALATLLRYVKTT